MANKTPISGLKAKELRARLGLSRTYAFELTTGRKRPSLEMAARIQKEFGVPASAWVEPCD